MSAENESKQELNAPVLGGVAPEENAEIVAIAQRVKDPSVSNEEKATLLKRLWDLIMALLDRAKEAIKGGGVFGVTETKKLFNEVGEMQANAAALQQGTDEKIERTAETVTTLADVVTKMCNSTKDTAEKNSQLTIKLFRANQAFSDKRGKIGAIGAIAGNEEIKFEYLVKEKDGLTYFIANRMDRNWKIGEECGTFPVAFVLNKNGKIRDNGEIGSDNPKDKSIDDCFIVCETNAEFKEMFGDMDDLINEADSVSVEKDKWDDYLVEQLSNIEKTKCNEIVEQINELESQKENPVETNDNLLEKIDKEKLHSSRSPQLANATISKEVTVETPVADLTTIPTAPTLALADLPLEGAMPTEEQFDKFFDEIQNNFKSDDCQLAYTRASKGFDTLKNQQYSADNCCFSIVPKGQIESNRAWKGESDKPALTVFVRLDALTNEPQIVAICKTVVDSKNDATTYSEPLIYRQGDEYVKSNSPLADQYYEFLPKNIKSMVKEEVHTYDKTLADGKANPITDIKGHEYASFADTSKEDVEVEQEA